MTIVVPFTHKDRHLTVEMIIRYDNLLLDETDSCNYKKMSDRWVSVCFSYLKVQDKKCFTVGFYTANLIYNKNNII